MQAQRQRFVEGAVARGIGQKKAAKIFDLMEFFAGYGFNKSHSTTYALLAYQTAYLKANYPAHFMAALLTIESQNTEKLALYLGECRELGIQVLPPDVNASELAFTVTPCGVRVGLGAVKNVGEGAIASILSVRGERGRIDSIFRLCEETDLRLVNKRVLESLVKAGALDSLAPGGGPAARAWRARLAAAVDRAIEHGNRIQRDRDQGQSQLFGDDHHGGDAASIPLPEGAPWTDQQLLAFEKETLGLYLSGHPLERYASELRQFGAKTTAELLASEADVAVGGVISGCRQLKTRKGDRMASFMLDDALGSVETVVFPETFSKCVQLIENDTMVLVRGKLEKDEDAARLLAAEILPLAAVTERVARGVAIRLELPRHGRGTFEALADLLARHRGDRPVHLELELRSHERPLRVHADIGRVRVRPSERLRVEVEQICGAGAVEIR
jgi:DNA polymerase-3 subunit alpha